MDKFINAGIEGNKLNILNDIRMNMQVTYVSEISKAKGDEICERAIQCKTVKRKIGWQKKRKITTSMQALWKENISKAILQTGTMKLRKPLGQILRENHRWVYNEYKKELTNTKKEEEHGKRNPN